ncbi:hypothetical protein AG1IA_10249 [Rhizoctonia solani AG-1 IA]|uniref:Uncharacterized protein n=1 Tax=Thanatephorus cucumeris (strain AG1-IA) TaxID=983506 RepID=L8WCP4_THACA|nr:hypothetical protein AG1IA_10249 [Rhizoctonia solani AG-1 IA]
MMFDRRLWAGFNFVRRVAIAGFSNGRAWSCYDFVCETGARGNGRWRDRAARQILVP